MADTPSAGISAADGQALLAGFDTAWQQVLHARYGGGVLVCLLGAHGEGIEQVLRETGHEPGHAHGGYARLVLQPLACPDAAPNNEGIMVGTARLPGGAQPAGIDVVTELFDDYDANEAADAASLHAGLSLARTANGGPAGGLSVIRSVEAGGAGCGLDRRQARGWLPQQIRLTPGRTLGLSANGHRRAVQARVATPVSAALLGAIGAAVAVWNAGRQGTAERDAIGAIALVVETSSAASL